MAGSGKGPSFRLPEGVRDYLPEAAARRRTIVEALAGSFERWGYLRIITPAFELEEVLRLGLGAQASSVRFVDPGSGEIAALRPDFTPQVARLVATRLRDLGGPIRLAYDGTVTRGGGRGDGGRREVIQAGIELIDAPSPAGDVEVLALAAEALATVGLADATLDVSEVGAVREALAAVPAAARAEARALIAQKDRRGVHALAAGLPTRERKLLEALPSLYAGPDPAAIAACLRDARRLVSGRAARAGLDALGRTLEALRAEAPELRVVVDLGEVRGFDYYTGVRFAGFALGASDAVLTGGRYDDLVARYGRAARATGFAVDVEAVARAHKVRAEAGGGSRPTALRPVTLVAGDPALARRAAACLREEGRPASCDLERRSERELREYAERAGHEPIVEITSLAKNGIRVVPQRGKDDSVWSWLPGYIHAKLRAAPRKGTPWRTS